MATKPHILILMCDQMQHRRMGFVDGATHTPNLDRLAGEGVHFTHMIAAHGQCVPSRAAFMTGQSAHQCGVMINYGFYKHQNRLSPHQDTLAKELKANGYHTVYFGKSHLGRPLAELGFDLDRSDDKTIVDDDAARKLGIEHVPSVLRRDYLAVEDAVEFLRNYQPGDQPLAMVFSTNLPHPPFFAESKFKHLYPADKMVLPESFHEESFAGKPAFQQKHVNDGTHGGQDQAAVREMISDYSSMISIMDEHFGRIIGEFQRLNMWDRTLALFFADHGDMMGSHRMLRKGTLPYDELYRVPCIFKLPGNMVSRRAVIDDLVGSYSLAGTLLKLAEIPAPESFVEGDFADAFRRDRHQENERVFFEHYAAYWGIHPFYGVRTRGHKYVRYYGDDQDEEMYDLIHDPHELTNIAHDPKHDALKRHLSDLAEAWWTRTKGRDFAYYESDYFRHDNHHQTEAQLH